MDALAGQVGGGAGPQDEAPVGALGQQQLPAGLGEPAALLAARYPPRNPLHHCLGGPLPLRHHPGVGVVEPVIVIAPLAPAGGGGAAHLQGRTGGQHPAQMDETHPCGGAAAEEFGQEARPLEPPVAEQLRIEGSHQQRVPLHGLSQGRKLGGTALQVGLGMGGHPQLGRSGVVGLLVVEGADPGGDPVELQAQGPAAADPGGLQLLLGQIPAQVAVEFPVGPITRIAPAGTPHRQGRLAVAAEEGHPTWRTDRGVHPVAGPRQGMEQPVAIQEAVTQAAAGHGPVEALVIGAFRQPDAQGALPQQALVLPHRRDQLGMDRLGGVPQQRQVAVGGGAGDQIQHPRLLQAAEAGQKVAAAAEELLRHTGQLGLQGRSGVLEGRGGLDQELAALLQPGQEAAVQGPVAQQAEQGGGEAEGEARLAGRIEGSRLEHLHQGEVALLQRLEVPVLLKGAGLSRTDVGKMGVENQGQIACGHGSHAFRAL